MRAARWLLALVGLQLALVGVYLAVEGTRTPEPPFSWERLDAEAPPLAPARGEAPVPVPTEPHLVHFWATWCAPCQAELPALLAAAEEEGVPLLAVTDEPWPVVRRYFDEAVPAAVVRDPTGEAARAWRVSGLPDTLAVRDGRLVGRMGGPRDWDTSEARAFLRTLRRR